jgi:PAS domain S-box-containing protein
MLDKYDSSSAARRVTVPESLVLTFLYASSDCIVVLDPVGNFRHANRAWLGAMQLAAKSELAGRNWQDVWPGESRALAVDAIQRAHQGLASKFTAHLTTAKGETRWFEVTAGPVSAASGGLSGILVQARNVTEFKQREGELENSLGKRELALGVLVRQLETEAQRLSRAAGRSARDEKARFVGRFLGNLIHEFRNVLTALSATARALRQENATPPQTELFDILDRSLARGSKLVGELSDLLRVEADQPEAIDIAALVNAMSTLLPALLGARVELRVEVDPECWPVAAAAARLQATLLGLVADAAEAMPQGGRLTLAARNCYASERPSTLAAGDYVVITVIDTGCGMPPEAVARAGQAARSAEPAAAGHGPGLVSAFELAEQCRGWVTIESEAGVGTSVSLFLPSAGAPVGGKPELASMEPEPHGDATILILDPDEAARSQLATTLRALNYRVIEAALDEVANAVLSSGVRVDLVCVNLGSGGGVAEAAGGWRAAHPTLAVIFMTGSSSMCGSFDELVFRKPIAAPLLAKAVLEKLGRAPGSVLPADALRLSDRVRERIRDPRVRQLYDLWRSLAARLDRLPSSEDLSGPAVLMKDHCCLLRIEGDADGPQFRVVHVGTALKERLGRDLTGERITPADQDFLGSVANAYGRALGGVAYFDYARFPLRDGVKLLFERLILPLSEDRQSVTHLFGIVSFAEIGDPHQELR